MGHEPDWADDSLDDLDPVSREAVTWLVIMQGEKVTSADRSAFRAWLRRDPRHSAAYADMERIWSSAPELRRSLPGAAPRAGLTRRTFGKAAVATLVAGGGVLLYQQHPFADFRTATGERRKLTLPDQSTVEMATATALSLDFRPELRVVELHGGEAFFSVAADRTRPFVVQAASGQTVTTDAAFNIAWTDDNVRVTVAEHAVNLRFDNQAMHVKAGTQAAYGHDGITAPTAFDPAMELAWREGRLVFVSVPFGRVIASLNLWRRGRLIVMSDALARRPVTLIVDLEKSEDILSILQDTLPIRLVHAMPHVALIFEA